MTTIGSPKILTPAIDALNASFAKTATQETPTRAIQQSSREKNRDGLTKDIFTPFHGESVPKDLKDEFLKDLGPGEPSALPRIFAVEGKTGKKLNLAASVSILQGFDKLNKGDIWQLGAINKIWAATFPDAIFYAFLDTKTQPIKLGSLESLKKLGIVGPGLVTSLLAPQEAPTESMVLFSSLLRSGLLPCAPGIRKSYISKVDRLVSEDDQAVFRGTLLVDTSISESSELLKALLDMGTSANSMAEDTGDHALSIAQGKNLALLLDRGGNLAFVPKSRLEEYEDLKKDI